MKYQPIKPPTKAQIEAANNKAQKKAIEKDINTINQVVEHSCEFAELKGIHKYIDGKYQSSIADWGKSMYGYIKDIGFNYNHLDVDSLKENLMIMKAKLEAFTYGWNALNPSSRSNFTDSPDVNLTVNNSVTVNITFEQVRSQIEDMTSLTDEQTKEALDKISEIESVVKSEGSKKSKWEKIKPILTWMADKSFDVGMALLPLLLKLQG